MLQLETVVLAIVNMLANVIILIVGLVIKKNMARADDVAEIKIHLAHINGAVQDYKEYKSDHNHTHAQDTERVRDMILWCQRVHGGTKGEP